VLIKYGGDMNQSEKIRSLTNYHPTYNIILTGIAILTVVLSLFLSPKILVSAQTNLDGTQNLTNHSFLPIMQQGVIYYYVSLQGNDSNPGTFYLPWRTIGKAAHMVEPGDSIYIRGGVYQEAVEFSSSGTASAPIKILAYPGETPVLDGNNYTLPKDFGGSLLEISGNYISVTGIEVRYSSYLGVLLAGVHDTVTGINSHHNLHSGMRIEGDFSIIENSLIWSNDMQNYNGEHPEKDSTAITASRRPNYATIRHNKVFSNWGIGLSTYEANGTIIEDNIVYDNYGPNIYISDATNILFQRNFVYATGSMLGGPQIGIQMGDETNNPPSSDITIINNIVYGTNRNLACWEGSSHQMTNVLIANNTFVNSKAESGIVFKEGLSFQNVRFMNNLTQQTDQLPIILVRASHLGLTFSNNLWSKTPTNAASSPNDIVGDPLFAQTGDPHTPEWFMLTGVSPAINKALALSAVNVDYFGIPRLPLPDVGANEFFPNP